jgi:hypothetical protein
MAINAYIYGRGIVRGTHAGVNADGDALVQTIENRKNKKIRCTYATSDQLVVPSAFPALVGGESSHNDLMLATARNYRGYPNVIETIYEYGRGGENDPWFTAGKEGDVRTTLVTYVEDNCVKEVRDDAFIRHPDKIKTDWDDDVHAGTEEKDISNGEFVAAIREYVSQPHRGRYLVLDSAAGGTSQALAAAFGPVRIIVPNPQGFMLRHAWVEPMSAEEYFQERLVLKLHAIYLDFTCQAPNAARHLTEMLIHGWVFEGQLIAITANNRTRKATFKDTAFALFVQALTPYFSLELLHYREYARMGFFICRVQLI